MARYVHLLSWFDLPFSADSLQFKESSWRWGAGTPNGELPDVTYFEFEQKESRPLFFFQTGTASTNSYKYTGREDDGTGLYYYRARYYQPRMQRFIAEDPIGFSGGDANLYAYAENSPLNLIDPTGLLGFGVSGGGTVEVGDAAGAAYQASSGFGVFGGGNQGVNFGSFTAQGGFAGRPVNNPDSFVLGGTAGLGSGLFFTNAKCAKELLGPFDTWNVNLPIISFQFATDGNIRLGSFPIGRSFGFSFSRYRVTTQTASGCNCK